jgi:hypothetical protein
VVWGEWGSNRDGVGRLRSTSRSPLGRDEDRCLSPVTVQGNRTLVNNFTNIVQPNVIFNPYFWWGPGRGGKGPVGLLTNLLSFFIN